jgi:AbrB family looped-hinge helix DNA binding protein
MVVKYNERGLMVQPLRISPKGWVVIPKNLRKKYGLAPGSRVAVVDYGGVLSIVPVPEDPIAALRGMFSSYKGSLTAELLEEHRREQERDERRFAT